MTSSNSLPSLPSESPTIFAGAIGYWERRRIIYNFLLAAVVVVWIAATWPHFRPAFNWGDLLRLLGLAALANVCYCAAYVADLPLQYSSFRDFWRHWRWTLFVIGTLFAILFANYWIADEIYSYVGPVH
ncbi:MAG TPA: hypothetical protein VKB26_07915 [Candidatus Acidoferrales bacterium]|nr:hypothetical protein [Candidatus Acidoferrales bacterium]